MSEPRPVAQVSWGFVPSSPSRLTGKLLQTCCNRVRLERMSASTQPRLSVVLPVYNAMPWLAVAVRDMLKQRLDGDEPLELLAAFDGGDDGSLAFLLALVRALGAAASDEVCEPPAVVSGDAAECAPSCANPALARPLRAEETVDHPTFAAEEAPPDEEMPSVAEVAAACRPEHTLRVLRYSDGINRGQGAAMSLALARATAPLIAQHESDDERRPADAYARMLRELDAHPGWDGVSCVIELVGWRRRGMEGYAAWQNGLLTPLAMSSERFVEIPALHQTCVFRREAVARVLASSAGAYRDGPQRSVAAAEGGATAEGGTTAAERAHGDALDTPVDLWWWLSFFHEGCRCGKLDSPLFGWRQHPRQHTRTHGRLSIDNLRAIKVHFLLRAGGPLAGYSRVVVLSVGATLAGWARDLRAHPACARVEIVELGWAPAKKGRATLPPGARLGGHKRKLSQSESGDSVGGACEGGVGEGGAADQSDHPRTMRLWAFGSEAVRRRVKEQVEDWDAATDLFVA